MVKRHTWLLLSLTNQSKIEEHIQMLSPAERGQKTERILYCQLMKSITGQWIFQFCQKQHIDKEPSKEPLVYFHIYKAIRVNGETFPTKETMNVFCKIPQQQPQVNHTLSDCKYNVNAAERSLEKTSPSRNQSILTKPV